MEVLGYKKNEPPSDISKIIGPMDIAFIRDFIRLKNHDKKLHIHLQHCYGHLIKSIVSIVRMTSLAKTPAFLLTFSTIDENLIQLTLDQDISNVIFMNTSQAAMVTDAQNRIVAVNPAFEKMTGYQAEDVISKTPSILSSGRHTPCFYQKLWQDLEEHDHWEGEIWNRKSNGEAYLEWLCINVVRSHDGAIHHHIALFSDITKRKLREIALLESANTDFLTQLPNRRLFMDRLDQAMLRTERGDGVIGLLFIDLDDFKTINDQYGHHVGDDVLIEIAARIKGLLRATDTVARIGGDEFTVILNDIKSIKDIEITAASIIELLHQPLNVEGKYLKVAASVGISTYPDSSRDAKMLIQLADKAMYQSKQLGGNQFQFSTSA